MTTRPALRLRKDEDRRIRAGHTWVFSNEVDIVATPLAPLAPGTIVEILDSRSRYVGTAYANPQSLISARILSRDPAQEIDEAFLRRRIISALELRQDLFPGESDYRLIFGEGDGLPGLVVDRFGDVLVVQPTTAGMEALLNLVVDLLVDITSATGVLIRADSPSRQHEGLERYVREAHGVVPATVRLRENGVAFDAPILEGQKTGWFFDHRRNRARLESYVPGARVLDVFSYIGGWGVQAAVLGAEEVVCVDSSAVALDGVSRNAALNDVGPRVATRHGDAFEELQALKARGEKFDVVVLDPPAFIKRKRDIKDGEQAYRRLNRLGLDLLAEGGVLVSASCSFHMSRDMLLRGIVWAAAQSGREIQLVEEGHQGPDHPVHPAIPETNYLKAFFVRSI